MNDPQYWLGKWKTNDIGFNQAQPNEHLVAYFSDIAPGKILVPLCGKSVDMIWLQSRGWNVTGIELSPIACESFFIENNIQYEKRSCPDKIHIYQSDKITIWNGDIFDMPQEVFDNCQAIYDRAALIALPPAIRKKYARHLIDKCKPETNKNLRMLLNTIHYDREDIGPPFSVPEAEVRALYGNDFTIVQCDSSRDEDLSKRSEKFSALVITEETYVLTAKG